MRTAVCLTFLLSACSVCRGDETLPPRGFTREVATMFTDYCRACHTRKTSQGGLNLDSFESLLKGGKTGPGIVPGRPEESLALQMMEKRTKPHMPPMRSLQPEPEEIRKVREWIAAGARKDHQSSLGLVDWRWATVGLVATETLSRIAPVATLAFSPDGNLIALGGRQEVLVLRVEDGELLASLSQTHPKVTAVAFSADGQSLAAASGLPGKQGELRVYTVSRSQPTAFTPRFTIAAHKDLVHELSFSADGKLLATCSYDHLVKLWDAYSGKELKTLADHSDAVYSVAFSPSGNLLASAGADRAVKIWDPTSGQRLYTLAEASDWVYAVAWSPDSKHVAAAGVDRSIRIWEVTRTGGKLLHSAFAHEAPVLRLTYSRDGKTLYSVGEDGQIKAWDVGRLVERRVHPKQPEIVLALALRPDQRQLALGRYDGVALLVDAETGQPRSQLLPVEQKPMSLKKVSPDFGQRGAKVPLRFEGKGINSASEVVLRGQGRELKQKIQIQSQGFQLDLPENLSVGQYQLLLRNAVGDSNPVQFQVDLGPLAQEAGYGDSPLTAQTVKPPVTIAGVLERAGDVDFFRLELAEGQELGIQVESQPGAKFDPVLRVSDESGKVIEESSNALIGLRAPKKGTFIVGIRDREYRGDANHKYRLHLGEIPIVTSVFPLGLQAGTEQILSVQGVFLEGQTRLKVVAGAEHAVGSRIPVSIKTSRGAAHGNREVIVGEFPEVLANPLPNSVQTPAQSCGVVPVPGTANGRLHGPGCVDHWRFAAKRGTPLVIETHARRLGSEVDTVIEILDSAGRSVPRATLRSVARTYVTFRDHDSANPNIRLESWNELAINDHIYVGSELLKLKAMPTHPDADAIFFSSQGQRTGFFGTTPAALPMGAPMYKVEIHPPGSRFPPNGYPVFDLVYRNDDGGPSFNKDSHLLFVPPEDAEYQVKVSDSGLRSRGAYRLTIRPPRPSFKLSFTPSTPSIFKGGGIPVRVSVEREDGFDGAIQVQLENLPPGFSSPSIEIEPGESSTSTTLHAESDAVVSADASAIKLVGKAVVDGKELVHEVVGGRPKLVDSGDITIATDRGEAELPAGGEARIGIRVERMNGFAGRIPIEVLGLPHGVKVKDIGLNGILVTEKEAERTIVLYAEPWVSSREHPIAIVAKREGKNVEHAARPVLLKIIRR